MDRGVNDGIEHDMRNRNPNNYNSSGISSDWRLCSINISNTPMSSVDPGNPPAACREDLMGSSSCSSAPMADPFGPPALWDQPTSVQNMGYCGIALQRNLSTLSPLGGPKVGLGPAALRSDISWNPPVSMLKEGIFLPNAPGILPVSLTQFPADSGFIERAARFSCFSGGGFEDMVNPLGDVDATGMCPREEVRMPVPMQREVFPIDSVKLLPPQRNSINTVEASKDAVLSSMPENCEVDQLKTVGRSENLIQSTDEQPKEVVRGSGDDSNQPDFSGGGGEDGKEEKESGSKKRKRNGQDAEFDATVDGQPAENAKNVDEIQQKIEQSPNSASGKAAGKNNKQGSQASEPPKEYIHIRARRGQATNSHSLAERVRREKISERMKFLQDLVPGCSKVTGKAVMLDEIINYVQSLQRQVEFLSMKLATVNPRLDFNIEGLLAKDILHSRAGPSSTLGFFSDMPVPYPPAVHPPSTGLIQACLNGIGMIPDSLRGNLHNQISQVGGGGSKESAQSLNTWEDELNNVVQMGFNGSASLSSQDNTDGSVPAGHAKVEL